MLNWKLITQTATMQAKMALSGAGRSPLTAIKASGLTMPREGRRKGE